MAILILNRDSYSIAQYDQWLAETGEELILLSMKEKEHEFQHFPIHYTFDDYEKNGCVELTALELYEKYQYHTVIATSEMDILRAAQIRERLGIAGQSLVSALSFRDKYVMKKVASDNGIKVTSFAKIESTCDLLDFIQKNGYPVVVKPLDGMGSVNTKLIYDRQQLKDYVSKGVMKGSIVESFVEGELYHVNGLVLNGKIVQCWPCKYISSPLAFAEGAYNGGFLLDEKNVLTNRLNDFTRQILQSFPTPENASFHAEIFHTKDDELVLCEIASRTAGRPYGEMFELAFGFNLTKAAVQAQCGLSVDLPLNVKENKGPKIHLGCLKIPTKSGVFLEGPKSKPPNGVLKFTVLAKPKQTFIGPSGPRPLASFIIKGNSEEQVRARIDEAAYWFNQEVVWDS